MFFFFNDTATTEIYTYLHTLSLHDALPIYPSAERPVGQSAGRRFRLCGGIQDAGLSGGEARSDRADDRQPALVAGGRSEEHTSELQSLMRISYAVFCLKKKNIKLPT